MAMTPQWAAVASPPLMPKRTQYSNRDFRDAVGNAQAPLMIDASVRHRSTSKTQANIKLASNRRMMALPVAKTGTTPP